MSLVSIFTHDVSITESVIDIMGHVNNVAYIQWMQDVAVAHSNANGWSWGKYQTLGAAWVARSHQIEYLKSAFRDDTIRIETWVAGLKRVSSIRKYRFLRLPDLELIARAETKWAFIRLADAMPIRIPARVSESFEIVERNDNAVD